MEFSAPTLHPPVLVTPEHKDLFANSVTDIAGAQFSLALDVAPAGPATSLAIPLTTVSAKGNFDAYISIRYRGSPASSSTSLLVDSGNSALITPDFTALSKLPHFGQNYTILDHNVIEPWGCPAKLMRGSIDIPTRSGGVLEIPNCVFYACTAPNDRGQRTANFGVGCISPWQKVSGISLQSPLACISAYPYAEFNYAPVQTMLSINGQLNVSSGSSLVLYSELPDGYQLFSVLKNINWMSLVPRKLEIGDVSTSWPGEVEDPIAMIDTGGGPLFLSDPLGSIYKTKWPGQVALPDWAQSGSLSCQAIKGPVILSLGDTNRFFSYRIDTTSLPASVQGLTMVLCEKCYYMMGNNGLNIGGISALFNFILIDYDSARVGFKGKPSAAV